MRSRLFHAVIATGIAIGVSSCEDGPLKSFGRDSGLEDAAHGTQNALGAHDAVAPQGSPDGHALPDTHAAPDAHGPPELPVASQDARAPVFDPRAPLDDAGAATDAAAPRDAAPADAGHVHHVSESGWPVTK